MTRVLHIARREWLELSRQRAMLGLVAALFLSIAGLAVGALVLLQLISADADRVADLPRWMPGATDGAAALDGLTGTVVTVFTWLIFTQYLGIAAVLAGHTVLHDRQTAALPFLLLAPVRRVELLAGKVLGAMGPPLVLYLVLSGGASVLAALLPVTSGYRELLPPSPAWLVAFALGGPVWAFFTCTLAAIASALARDVRTAQQGVWFVMFFLTFVAGGLLSALLPQGAGVQVIVALLGASGAAVALVVGGAVISREVAR